DYALHFLETFKKPNVGEVTYSNYVRITKLHIIKALGEKKVGDVSASNCQNLLSSLLEEGKGRTTEEVKNLLTWIFDGAVADHLIDVSPMRTVRVPKHRREIGKCMPKDVLTPLIGEPKSRYDYIILLLAYTGLRPGEVKSAVFIDGFITVRNGKTPTNAPPSFRRFPLHTRLLPYVKQIEENVDVNMDEVSRHFRKKVKGYRLYDLRHTFTTYIQESGANSKWVDYVTNHVGAQNVTQKVYTHWTDDFQRKEMEKLQF
ncbi:MAG: tyrosine-type recombinase/integrase family protein, partial [Clostridia bacterium]|nr:tyrosine-type recombinase/integrase family protein [Clostridia bacterium]